MTVFIDIFLFIVSCVILFIIGYFAIYVLCLTNIEWSELEKMNKLQRIAIIIFLISLMIAAAFGIYLIAYNIMNPELTRMQVFIYGIKKIWWDYLLMFISYIVGFGI